MSKRSFARRVDFATATPEKEKMALARLNNSLDKFYEMLYDAYPSIDEDIYKLLSPHLSILIETLQNLINTYENNEHRVYLSSGIERLKRNLNSIVEIDSDIHNFRINIYKNQRFIGLMDKLKAI